MSLRHTQCLIQPTNAQGRSLVYSCLLSLTGQVANIMAKGCSYKGIQAKVSLKFNDSGLIQNPSSLQRIGMKLVSWVQWAWQYSLVGFGQVTVRSGQFCWTLTWLLISYLLTSSLTINCSCTQLEQSTSTKYSFRKIWNQTKPTRNNLGFSFQNLWKNCWYTFRQQESFAEGQSWSLRGQVPLPVP